MGWKPHFAARKSPLARATGGRRISVPSRALRNRSAESLAQVDEARVAVAATLVLHVSGPRVHSQVLGHQLVRVEIDRVETFAPCRRLRVLEQRPTDAASLMRRVDRDVVDEEALVVAQNDQAHDLTA